MSASSTASSDDNIRARPQQSPLASQRAKEQGKKGGPFSGNLFPMGYKEGFSQWWTNISPAVAEHRVLSFVPYLQQPPTHTQTGSAPPSVSPSSANLDDSVTGKATLTTTNSITDPYGPRTWSSNMVKLSGKNRALNEFSVQRNDEKIDQNLVILHGYGAGLGFFYKNFEGLSRQRGWKLYALDLLGMGRSSRPLFRISHKDRQKSITEAENWFIDALEEWRVQKKIDRFTLLGHSLGGYMAVAYALKYPGHLNKLILASPVGIPEDPYAVNAEMPEPSDSTMANEFTQDQEETTKGNTKAGDGNNFLNARSRAQKDREADPNKLPPRKPLPRWLTYLWDANISPFSLVRWSGPLGPRLVSGWTSRRFSHLPNDEAQSLHDYAYSLFRLRGSGEYALAYILAPGAFARSPLIRRIQGVGRQFVTSAEANGANSPRSSASERLRENGVPVVLMYGENDWMDVAGGYAAKQKLDEERAKVLKGKSKEEREKDNGETKLVIIKKAGHHVYLDGWEEFNDVMREEMDEVSRKSARGV